MAKQIISTINEHYRKKDESTLQCPQSAANRTDDDMPANLESCGSVTEKLLKLLSKILQMIMLSIINVHVVDYQELLQKCFRDLDKSVSHEKHGVSSS